MGNKFERLKLALLASAVWFALPATAGAGAITDYSFANASAVINGQQETITGSVTATLDGELSANISVSGFGIQFGAFTLPFDESPRPRPANTFIVGNLVIHYANDLSLTSVSIGSLTSSSASGSAVVVGGSSGFHFVDASAAFNGVTEQISGSFEIDASNGIQWVVLAQLTGPAPYAGSCSTSTELTDARTVYGNCAQLFGNLDVQTQFHFANDLLPGTADPLDAVRNLNYSITNVTGYAVSGDAVPPAVSEPGTLGLLVSGLLGLGFVMAAMFDPLGAVERRQGQSAAPHACSGLLTLGALARQRRSVALNSNSCRPLSK
jgi:hypothetical protein